MSVTVFGAGRLARGSLSLFSQLGCGSSFSYCHHYGSKCLRRGPLIRIRTLTGTPSSSRRLTPPSSKSGKVLRDVPKQKSKFQTMISNFLGPKPMPERYTAAWYGEMLLICTVFAITGSSTMVLVRPAVKDVLGIEGSFRDGPWTYRLCSLFIMSPIYAVLLIGVGTVVGRHFYFKRFGTKILSRFGFPPELIDKNWYKHEKQFRKW